MLRNLHIQGCSAKLPQQNHRSEILDPNGLRALHKTVSRSHRWGDKPRANFETRAERGIHKKEAAFSDSLVGLNAESLDTGGDFLFRAPVATPFRC